MKTVCNIDLRSKQFIIQIKGFLKRHIFFHFYQNQCHLLNLSLPLKDTLLKVFPLPCTPVVANFGSKVFCNIFLHYFENDIRFVVSNSKLKTKVCLQINHGFTKPSEHEFNSFVNELNFCRNNIAKIDISF